MLPGAFKTCESLVTSDTSECTQLLYPRQSFQNSKHASLLRNFDKGEKTHILYNKNIIIYTNFFCLSTLNLWNIYWSTQKNWYVYGESVEIICISIIFIKIRFIWLYVNIFEPTDWNYRVVYAYNIFMNGNNNSWQDMFCRSVFVKENSK